MGVESSGAMIRRVGVMSVMVVNGCLLVSDDAGGVKGNDNTGRGGHHGSGVATVDEVCLDSQRRLYGGYRRILS